MSGKARGSAPGVAAGFDVVQAPKNGKVTIEDASTFLFTPKKGFSGSDTMVLRLKYRNGDSATVRFAITVLTKISNRILWDAAIGKAI